MRGTATRRAEVAAPAAWAAAAGVAAAAVSSRGHVHVRVGRGTGPHAPSGSRLTMEATSSAQKPIISVTRCGWRDGSASPLPALPAACATVSWPPAAPVLRRLLRPAAGGWAAGGATGGAAARFAARVAARGSARGAEGQTQCRRSPGNMRTQSAFGNEMWAWSAPRSSTRWLKTTVGSERPPPDRYVTEETRGCTSRPAARLASSVSKCIWWPMERASARVCTHHSKPTMRSACPVSGKGKVASLGVVRLAPKRRVLREGRLESSQQLRRYAALPPHHLRLLCVLCRPCVSARLDLAVVDKGPHVRREAVADAEAAEVARRLVGVRVRVREVRVRVRVNNRGSAPPRGRGPPASY
eukprot:scaffold81933_cov64-Phaeocystis_antarctica.AAC.7